MPRTNKVTCPYLLLTACSLLPVSMAAADEPSLLTRRPIQFNIHAQNLHNALDAFGKQSQLQLFYSSDLVSDKQSPGINGQFNSLEALKALLKNSGLNYRVIDGNTITLEKRSEGTLTTENLLAAGGDFILAKAEMEDKPSANAVEQEDLTVTGGEWSGYNVLNAATATKTDTPLFETPASIQVIPKSVLHDQQAFRLEDVIKNVSGVQTQHSFGGDYETFVMRGFLQSTANYRNGIRIPATKFDLANVERVEVLKGTSAMLYGFGDAGGLITTVTKQPGSEPYYSLEQRFGSYDFYRTEASATGPLSREYGLNYRVDLSYLDTNSFRHTDKDRIFFAPSISWQATPDTKLTLTYEHFDEDNSYDNGTPAIGTRLASIPRSRTFMDPDLTNSNTNNLIDFRIDHEVNDHIKLNAGTVYSENKKHWETVYLGRVNEDATSPNFGNVSRNYWFGPEEVESLTAWINGVFDFDTYGVKHKLLLGGEYYDNSFGYQVASGGIDTVNIFSDVVPQISAAQLQQFRTETPIYDPSTTSISKAIYLQDQMTFWEKLHITGGFRYDWVERSQTLGSFWDDLSTPDIEGNDTRHDDHVSPRVALLYEATDWLSVFGSFSESFGPAFDYDAGGPKLYDLFPATQYEGGLKAQFFDGRLATSVVYFDLERTQFVNNDFGQPFSSVPFKGRSNGVELDIQGQIYDGLSLIATYAYMDTKILEDSSNTANVGNRLPYAPEHQGSLWLKYDFNSGPLQGLTLGSGVYASGERFGGNENSYFDEAYARLDLMAAYKQYLGDATITTQLNINNVNDAEYFNLRRRRGNLPAEPLSVMGSIRLEY